MVINPIAIQTFYGGTRGEVEGHQCTSETENINNGTVPFRCVNKPDRQPGTHNQVLALGFLNGKYLL